MNATRRDVADRAGVSTAVVSYVVNNGPGKVAAATRARVEAAIRELDYRPNVMARALKGGVTGTVGLLLPSPSNPFFAELSEAIQRVLVDSGKVALIGVSGGATKRVEQYLELFAERRADGLIVASDRALENGLKSHDIGIRVVSVDRPLESIAAPTVLLDNEGAAEHAVAHLQDHGHTVIGCVAGPPGTFPTGWRVAGWRRTQVEADNPAGDDLVAHGEFTEVGGEIAAHALLGRERRAGAADRPRPTALFVSSDIQAIGVMHACEALGLAVPDDVAIVSVDGTRIGEYARPSLTSLRQPVDEIAKTAVDELLFGSGTTRHELSGNLFIGSSCGCGAPSGQGVSV